MKKAFLDKLNGVYFKVGDFNESSAPTYIYRFIEKVGSKYNFIVCYPNYVDGGIVFKITHKQLESTEFDSLIPVKSLYNRLIVSPVKVLVDPKTKFCLTIDKDAYAFFDSNLADMNLKSYNFYTKLDFNFFENPQKIKDEIFEQFINITKVFNDDAIMDYLTKMCDFYKSQITQNNKNMDYVQQHKNLYYHNIGRLKGTSEEYDFNSTIKDEFDDLIDNTEELNEAIKNCNKKYGREINVDTSDLNQLIDLSYEDKKYILIARLENVVNFDFEATKEKLHNKIDIIQNYMLWFFKQNGMINENETTIAKQNNMVDYEPEEIDFSNLN